MTAQKIKLSFCDVTWLVLDDNHLPIKPITEFVRYLNNVDKSPCTVKSYTYCLKLFWDYLADKQLNWGSLQEGTEFYIEPLQPFTRLGCSQ